MVLQGGKIPIRTITSSPTEKPTYSPLKMVRKQLRVHHRGLIRKGRTIHNPDIGRIEPDENECKPWDFFKI